MVFSFLGALAGAAFWIAAFSIDSATAGDSSAARNTQLAAFGENYEVGGLGRSELEELVAQIAESESQREATLVLPDSSRSVSLGDLGIEVDVSATVAEILNERRSGGFFNRLVSWSGSFFGSDRIALQYRATGEIQAQNIPDLFRIVAEPASASWHQPSPSQALVFVPEQIGSRVDLASLTFSIQDFVNRGIPPDQPLEIKVGTTPVYPQVRNRAVSLAVRRANDLTIVGLDITLDGEVRRMNSETYREAFVYSSVPFSDPEADGSLLRVSISRQVLQEKVEALFADYLDEAGEIRYSFSDAGVPQPRLEGENFGCCAPIRAGQIDTLLEGATILRAETTSIGSQFIEEFPSLEIRELISEHRSIFPPSSEREQNIAVAADLLYGAVIFPGDRWSMNSRIGPRITANGYVPAETVYRREGPFQVGGGADVVATALFNAAFEAGLGIPFHESRRVYIDDSPLGLDMGLSSAFSDLILTNSSPYGVLILTERNLGSVTVSIYSTRYFEDVSSEQVIGRSGGCVSVRTERTRRLPQGVLGAGEERELTDSFRAFYLPDWWTDCDGTPLGGGADA